MTVQNVIKIFLNNSACDSTLKEIRCRKIVPDKVQTEVCYLEHELGYFMVSKSYMDKINVVFNRWD